MRVLLLSFGCGSADLLLQIPGALLARRIGARWAVGIAVLGSSGLSAFVPMAARTSISAVYFVRLGQGICQGCLFPSVATIWSRWAPPAERSRLAAFPQVGGFVGTLLCGGLGGWQCDHRCDPDVGTCDFLPSMFGGWEGVFSLHAILGVVWLLLWSRVGYSSPELHPVWQRRDRLSAASSPPTSSSQAEARSSRWSLLRPSAVVSPTWRTTLETMS